MRALACALFGTVATGVAACSQPARPLPPPIPVRIVATERGPTGGRLVVIDEAGLRVAELLPEALVTVRDNSAVFSPDGAWIAFASSRGRGEDMKHTSLWLVAAKLDAPPYRITDDHGDDLAPAWTPDGSALVFTSDRGGGFALWRLPLAHDADRLRADGAPQQLTHDPGAALAPSIGPDGRIAYAAIARDTGGTVTSAIEVQGGDGLARPVTGGPGDVTPAWSPDGKTIAFSAPIAREFTADDGSVHREIDADILAVDADGGHRRVLVEAPGTDESGPVWSRDGRWLFATSVARSAAGKPLLSSIVYADLRATPIVVRMLREPSAPVSRLGPALAPAALDDATLAAGPVYQDALSQILIHALQKQEDLGSMKVLAVVFVGLAACGGAHGAGPAAPESTVAAPISRAADAQMVAIPAGRYVAGSTPEERAAAYDVFLTSSGRDIARKNKWFENEDNRHVTELPAYAIDLMPVTNAAYAEFVDAGGAPAPTMDLATWKQQGFDQDWTTEVARFVWQGGRPPPERADHPVVLVSWEQATAYCAWRGRVVGAARRLPTEAEMEKAARGAMGMVFPWGEAFDATKLVSRAGGTDDTGPAGSVPAGASPFGVLDMAGNVYQWTSTPWPIGTDAAHADKMTVKGSAWDDFGGLGRGAARHGRGKTIRHAIVGFRCAGDAR